ncbi:MAG: hypothetical protein EP329_22940 [Deltaproteobacteria bacterium]|nr:MAG: hypothetical protein EP329_22940 [Deltaproteobacteria bacterium]
MRKVRSSLLLAPLFLVACAGADGPAPLDGPTVAIDVAALNLQGVGDAVWDIEVVNGASPTAEVVWQRRLTSSGYGDGAGSASYVGPCDADPAVNENTVRVWVVGVFSAPVSSAGTFASGAAGGVVGTPMDFQNPTTDGPLERTVVCEENRDVAVQFDVALMRPAQQGFFDIAVNFNNIFCSAKFDCCTEDGTGTACASDIDLLFDATGARSKTYVLGFACTAGPGAGVETELYLDALTLDCSSPTAGSFAADFTLDPSGAAGNQCTAGADGMTACDAVVENGALDADDYLFQVAVFRGIESLTSGGVVANKVYWNVALGVKDPAIQGCWLKTRGTADDANGTGVVAAGTIAAGSVYPYLQWEVDLGTCLAEPLTFGDPAAMVRTAYTATGDAATSFTYGYGPNLPANPFVATYGDGGDGNLVVSAAFSLSADTSGTRTEPDGVAYQVTADPTGVTLATTGSAGLAAGDKVLLINLQGTDANNGDVGNWEVLTVASVGANSVTVLEAPTRTYTSGDFASQKVALQRIPQYGDVTVQSGGTLTTGAWSDLADLGSGQVATGVVALAARYGVDVQVGGAISADQLGFKGGLSLTKTGIVAGGESYAGDGGIASTAANEGGGGGGWHNPGLWSGGGGGASYGTLGENGSCDQPSGCGQAGLGYGDAQLSKLYLGSGGGGGSENDVTTTGRGGNGAGAIVLFAADLLVSGSVHATGETGHHDNNTASNDGGGSGSGGSVYLRVDTADLGTNLVTAAGGPRTVGVAFPESWGGAAGAGRIAVYYGTSTTGSTSPAAYSAQP